jgi:hypothetical protein
MVRREPDWAPVDHEAAVKLIEYLFDGEFDTELEAGAATMSYNELSRVFPWMVLVHEDVLPPLVALLISDSPDVQNGSSFAVTNLVAPDQDGYRWLWLSHVSERRLRQAALLAGLTGLRTNKQSDG